MYSLDQRQQALIAEAFCSFGGENVWDFSFRRDLTDIEGSDFAHLISMLDNVYLSLGKPDTRVWKPSTKGHFSVKSFNVSNDNSVMEDGWSSFWDPSILPRVLVFC